MDNNNSTINSLNDTLDSEYNLVEEEEMPTKFYNFNCINLYAYIDLAVAAQLTQAAQLNQSINHLINTPLKLYESPYIARLLSPTSNNRQLVAFAVYVENDIFDELNLALDINIKNRGKTPNEIKKGVSVIRQLEKYKETETGKTKLYISYTIQNQNAIKAVFPIR